MAVDNLPCEFPKEASGDFSTVVKKYVNEMMTADYQDSFEEIKLPYPIKRALILHNGQLTEEYNYMHKWVNEITEKIATFPSNDNAGMQAFSFLYFLFKIDYLLVPKYEIYQKMSKKIQEYFGEENSTIESKNEELRIYVNKLKDMKLKGIKKKFWNYLS